MEASREQRSSEKVFTQFWGRLLPLSNCLWYGGTLATDAIEKIDRAIFDLKQIKRFVQDENNLPKGTDENEEEK